MGTDPIPEVLAHPTHVRLLIQTRPWLGAVAVLLGVLCLVEGVLAIRALTLLEPMPDDPYLAGRWSIAVVSTPVHAVLAVGSGSLVASLVGQVVTIGRLKREGQQDELLATLRHMRRFWWRATVTVLSMIGLACGGGLLGLALVIRKAVSTVQDTP